MDGASLAADAQCGDEINASWEIHAMLLRIF